VDALGAWNNPMKFPRLQTLGIAVALFAAVYIPAFVTTALIRPPVQSAIPLVIGISLSIALVVIFLLARRSAGISEFGFTVPTFRYVGLAGLLGLPLGLVITWLNHQFPSKPPFDVSGLTPWRSGFISLSVLLSRRRLFFGG
jgi:hypothetical protein